MYFFRYKMSFEENSLEAKHMYGKCLGKKLFCLQMEHMSFPSSFNRRVPKCLSDLMPQPCLDTFRQEAKHRDTQVPLPPSGGIDSRYTTQSWN